MGIWNWDDIGYPNGGGYGASRAASQKMQKKFRMVWNSMTSAQWLALVEFWREHYGPAREDPDQGLCHAGQARGRSTIRCRRSGVIKKIKPKTAKRFLIRNQWKLVRDRGFHTKKMLKQIRIALASIH